MGQRLWGPACAVGMLVRGPVPMGWHPLLSPWPFQSQKEQGPPHGAQDRGHSAWTLELGRGLMKGTGVGGNGHCLF